MRCPSTLPTLLQSAAAAASAWFWEHKPFIFSTIQLSFWVSAPLRPLPQEIGINEIKEELNRPAVPSPRPPSANAAEYAGSSSSEGEQPKQQVGSCGSGRQEAEVLPALALRCGSC